MKRYIKANTALSQGAYLLSRQGDIIPVNIHVPSTTYRDRGRNHLCPTDAEFLCEQGKISFEEALIICKVCLVEFLSTELNYDNNDEITIMDMSKFNSYAELRYAPTLRKYLMNYSDKIGNVYTEGEEDIFESLNAKWYPWLQNNFVKVSVFNNVVEFRISSNDNFDWNRVIIDDCILKYDPSTRSSTKYTIVRESNKGYKAYFINATIDEILENDDVVLASKTLQRKVVAGELKYL